MTPDDDNDLSASRTFTTDLSQANPVRVEETSPRAYRLAMDPWGHLHLQGRFHWQEGRTPGCEWRTLPTVDLETGEPCRRT